VQANIDFTQWVSTAGLAIPAVNASIPGFFCSGTSGTTDSSFSAQQNILLTNSQNGTSAVNSLPILGAVIYAMDYERQFDLLDNRDVARDDTLTTSIEKGVDVKDEVIDRITKISERQKTNDNTIADDLKNTENSNNSATLSTETANESRTKSTNTSIISRDYKTAETIRKNNNATAQDNTSTTKSTRTSVLTDENYRDYDVNHNTYYNELNLAEVDYYNTVRSTKYDKYQIVSAKRPVQTNPTGGNVYAYNEGQIGLDFRVKTLQPGIIDQVTSEWFRFGYSYNGYVYLDNIQKLKQMKHFTYWRTGEIWITGQDINESNKEILRKAFMMGTTIWSDPSKIGVINVKQNTL